jgi:hypothetical protein
MGLMASASPAVAFDVPDPPDAGTSLPISARQFSGPPEVVIWLCGDVLELSVVARARAQLVRRWQLGRRPTAEELAALTEFLRSRFTGEEAFFSAHVDAWFREVKDVLEAIKAAGFTNIVEFAVRRPAAPHPAIPHCGPYPSEKKKKMPGAAHPPPAARPLP